MIISWMVTADAESEERNDNDSSSHFFTDETWLMAYWNSVTQGGNDNFCAFIIKLESEKF